MQSVVDKRECETDITLIQASCFLYNTGSVLRDKEVFFGPLSTTLPHLFEMGFVLQVNMTKKDLANNRKTKLNLRKGSESYKICSKRAIDFYRSNDLSDFIRDGMALLISSQSGIKVSNPLDVLLKKYPRKKKDPKTILIGNTNLVEYIKNGI